MNSFAATSPRFQGVDSEQLRSERRGFFATLARSLGIVGLASASSSRAADDIPADEDHERPRSRIMRNVYTINGQFVAVEYAFMPLDEWREYVLRDGEGWAVSHAGEYVLVHRLYGWSLEEAMRRLGQRSFPAMPAPPLPRHPLYN